jgi:hypothetical protein
MSNWLIRCTVPDERLLDVLGLVKECAHDVSVDLVLPKAPTQPPPKDEPRFSRFYTNRQKTVRKLPHEWASSQLVFAAVTEGVHDPAILRRRLSAAGFRPTTLSPAASNLRKAGLLVLRNGRHYLAQYDLKGPPAREVKSNAMEPAV